MMDELTGDQMDGFMLSHAETEARVTMATGYEAVIFDNDGVLVESPNTESFRRAIAETFRKFDLSQPNREDMRAILSRNTKAIRKLAERYHVDVEEFCREAATQTIREQKQAFEDGIRSLYDDVASLRSLDQSLGVVSDNQHSVVEYALRLLGLADLFDTIYGVQFTPDGLRRMKPNPYHLNKALEDIGTREALYVGDRARDVEAAANAGIDSVLLCRSGDTIDCGVAPTYVVSSLSAVPSLLD